MSKARQIKLGMFLRPAAHHIAGWRHKDAWADGGLNFATYVETARKAEAGLFDMMFSADALTGERYDRETLSRTSYVAWIEPMSLLTALAPVTKNIGLVCTATTTYDEPYHIARRFASLDLISGGRSGWNLVTSANDAEVEKFRPRAASAQGRALSARPRIRRCGAAVCGIPGTTTPSFSTRPRAASTTPTSATCSITRASSSRCAGRSPSRARRRVSR